MLTRPREMIFSLSKDFVISPTTEVLMVGVWWGPQNRKLNKPPSNLNLNIPKL